MNFVILMQNIRSATGGEFDAFMSQVSTLGQPLAVFMVLSFLHWCVDKRLGYMAGAVLSGSFSVEKGFSIAPSIVSMRSSALYSSLGIDRIMKSLPGNKKERCDKSKLVLGIVCLVILFFILVSRCYFGLEDSKDVWEAAFLPVELIFLFYAISYFINKYFHNKKKLIETCSLAIVSIILLVISKGGYGFGLYLGYAIGCIADNYLIKFKTSGDINRRICRYIPGAIFIFFLYTSGENLLGYVVSAKHSEFAFGLITTLFIYLIYPAIATIWESEAINKTVRKVGKIVVYFITFGSLAAATLLVAVSLYVGESASEVLQMARFVFDGDQIFWKDTGEETFKEEYIGIEVIAHRGYSGIAPENTIAAFKRAVDIGSDQIELDVQMTKDGEIVVFHDYSLSRITGYSGIIKDYNYSEICWLDAGSWYDNQPGSFLGTYKDERIPKLSEALNLIKDTNVNVNLELKNIGVVDGFAQKVVKVVQDCGMEDRVIFSSYNYSYLTQIKEVDENLFIEYISDTGDPEKLLADYPAEYYNLKLNGLMENTAEVLHAAGAKFYVWTLNDAATMKKAIEMGADGLVTNYPGIAKVLIHEEYDFLMDYYKASYEVPALYNYDLQSEYNNYVMQGFTKVGDDMVISAFDVSAKNNTILYILDKSGKLKQIVDIGSQAHAGGIAYDNVHGLLWVTGSDGCVYSYDYESLVSGESTEPVYSFDAGMYNQYGNIVVSFLAYDNGLLYVGSNMDGVNGEIKVYDITYPQSEHLESIISIPQHIQGVTFSHESMGRNKIIMVQSVDGEDSKLLMYSFSAHNAYYDEDSAKIYMLPEGAEQPYMDEKGLYLLFNSSARPYRQNVHLPNDRIWLLN